MEETFCNTSARLEATCDRLQRRMDLNTYLYAILVLLLIVPPLLTCAS